MLEYDVVVIGAGPGGYVCAIRAAQLGKKTAIIDRQWLGGVCLNVGCIPSKALLRNAEIAHLLRHGGKDFGFEVQGLKLDFPAAVRRSRQVAERLVKGVGFLMKKNKIDVHMGTAVFIDAHTVEVAAAGEKTLLTAKDIVIATGASPMMIPGVQADGKNVLTYLDAIVQERLPKSAVVIGASAIGCEFATVWNSYGVEVTLVEMLPRVAPLEDEEISQELAKAFTRRGVRVMAGTKVEGIEAGSAGVKVKVAGSEGASTIEAEQALVAIGVKPNTQGLGLEKIGVKTSPRGMVEIDDRMATNVAGVWAIGDVTGKLMLAHVASAMGIVAAEHIAGAETVRLDYESMPRAIYSQPQVASFGLTEAQAKERGLQVKVSRFPFQANGKALGMGDYAGWVKLVTEPKSGEILGAHLVGPEVTELLPELTLARMFELTPAEIGRNVHAHPTLSEAVMEAAHAAEGHSIHT
ncbi:MAG: dihydrolipoyl dehydrogenase [Chloroflexi bacterium]|nr:dihydrolipoyl dehydrogenase [Chloroflexota bacterium]